MLKPVAKGHIDGFLGQPPSGGCVLKLSNYSAEEITNDSRLQAAVC